MAEKWLAAAVGTVDSPDCIAGGLGRRAPMCHSFAKRVWARRARGDASHTSVAAAARGNLGS